MRQKMSAPAANDAPSLPPGTTLWELVVALQDAADQMSTSREEANALVFASLVEMRHQIRVDDEAVKKAA